MARADAGATIEQVKEEDEVARATAAEEARKMKEEQAERRKQAEENSDEDEVPPPQPVLLGNVEIMQFYCIMCASPNCKCGRGPYKFQNGGTPNWQFSLPPRRLSFRPLFYACPSMLDAHGGVANNL